jgi:sugar phosphate isomerase/epimerase
VLFCDAMTDIINRCSKFSTEGMTGAKIWNISFLFCIYSSLLEVSSLLSFPNMAMFKGIKIPTSYATCSIGTQKEHNLPAKLEVISHAEFDAIELSMPDLLSFASELEGKEVEAKDYDSLCKAGAEVKKLCQKHELKILMLQPFANFEGWPEGSSEREDAFERAGGWMRIMEAVGTDMLQVGSSDSPGISADADYLANDLAQLADMLAAKRFRICYENWCWSTHSPDWKDVWKIVKKVDRSNVGLCLDTFQSGGGEFADPTTKSGLREHMGRDVLEERWRKSLGELASTIPPEKIFLLQISDAYKMSSPLEDKPDESGLRPRGQWSHDYRPMPYDGGYLPVVDFTKAVLATGFRGYLSMEIFDGQEKDKHGADMGEFAEKAMKSVQRLLRESE